jgi:carboxymethylenebutenolidase
VQAIYLLSWGFPRKAYSTFYAATRYFVNTMLHIEFILDRLVLAGLISKYKIKAYISILRGIMGKTVDMGSISGYLAKPSGAGPWPGLIVIQEWWGLDLQTKSIADRFAAIRYLAFAPDLYHGELAKLGDDQQAAALVQKYAPAAPSDLEKVFDAIKHHPECNGKVGSVGFCFGGRMSLALGISRPLDAICTFYGGGMQKLFDQLGSLKSPVLGLFGDKDLSIPVGTVQQFDQLLGRIGVHHEVIVYPDSGHAFFRDTDPNVYKPEASRDAWTRVTKFFADNLG